MSAEQGKNKYVPCLKEPREESRTSWSYVWW